MSCILKLTALKKKNKTNTKASIILCNEIIMSHFQQSINLYATPDQTRSSVRSDIVMLK